MFDVSSLPWVADAGTNTYPQFNTNMGTGSFDSLSKPDCTDAELIAAGLNCSYIVMQMTMEAANYSNS